MPQAFSPQFLKLRKDINDAYPDSFRQSSGKTDRRRIPTGYFQVDRILDGGLPVNRISLIYGPKATYKSTFALRTIANWQKRCGLCLHYHDACICSPLQEGEIRPTIAVYIDTEHALDEGHAARLGVDSERFYLSRPPHGQAACEYAEKLAALPDVGFVVVDSLADLKPLGEIKSSYMDGQSRADRAKLIARMTRAMVTILDSLKYPRVCILLNHMLPNQNGYGWILPGGDTQKLNSSVVLRLMLDNRNNRLIVDRDGTLMEIKESDNGRAKPVVKVGPREQDLRVLLEHSKISPENVTVEFSIFLEENVPFRFSDADDDKAVFLSGQRLGWIYEEKGNWIDRVSQIKVKTQKALYQSWHENPRSFEILKMRLIQEGQFSDDRTPKE